MCGWDVPHVLWGLRPDVPVSHWNEALQGFGMDPAALTIVTVWRIFQMTCTLTRTNFGPPPEAFGPVHTSSDPTGNP